MNPFVLWISDSVHRERRNASPSLLETCHTEEHCTRYEVDMALLKVCSYICLEACSIIERCSNVFFFSTSAAFMVEAIP